MTTKFTKKPSFSHSQHMSFIGGEGIVRAYKLEVGIWTYFVEMALGPKPDFGRIGAETMVILPEAELCAA